MPIGLPFLGDDLPGHCAHLFKAFEREVERLVVERDHPAKRPLDILFDLIAMPWALVQHGENDDFAIHMLPSSMILLLMRVYHRNLGMSRELRGAALFPRSGRSGGPWTTVALFLPHACGRKSATVVQGSPVQALTMPRWIRTIVRH